MTQSISLKTVPSPMRMLFRPILFTALGLHALLLFAPLPAEQKPKEPDDKKNPIKVTQLPTATPPTAKPKATPAKTAKALPPKPAVAVAATRTLPTPSAPAINPFAASDAAIAASSKPATLANVQTQPFPPASTATTSTATVTPSKPFTGDPEKALVDLLTGLVKTSSSSASTGATPIGSSQSANPAPLEEIAQPELFFKGKLESQTPEKLPGLEKSPLFLAFPIEENLNLTSYYQKSLEPKLKAIFESVTEVGDYGDGPLYKLTRGNYTAYLSLVPPKTSVGAIISVWSKDPR